MQEMIRDLLAHKEYANAALLGAIQQDERAAADPELLALLHHVLLANRFWFLTIAGRPFDPEAEGRPPSSLGALVEAYRATHAEERSWIASAGAEDLDRVLEGPLIPGGRCTVSQAWMQVSLHSLGHRAQCAQLLRRHGGRPPSTDFILWLPARPAADWTGTLRTTGGT
jgi:uncharacterized damage-inducible protein DinB